MRYRKTPSNKRNTYILYDEFGKAIVEINSGEDGITAQDIKNLHAVDDHEVYVNCKEIRFTPFEKEQYLHQLAYFIENNHREPDEEELPSHRHFITINNAEDFSYDMFQEEPPAIIRLREIVESLPVRWQQVYKLVMLDGYTNIETAQALGLSLSRINALKAKIINKIRSDEFLKNFFK